MNTVKEKLNVCKIIHVLILTPLTPFPDTGHSRMHNEYSKSFVKVNVSGATLPKKLIQNFPLFHCSMTLAAHTHVTRNSEDITFTFTRSFHYSFVAEIQGRDRESTCMTE